MYSLWNKLMQCAISLTPCYFDFTVWGYLVNKFCPGGPVHWGSRLTSLNMSGEGVLIQWGPSWDSLNMSTGVHVQWNTNWKRICPEGDRGQGPGGRVPGSCTKTSCQQTDMTGNITFAILLVGNKNKAWHYNHRFPIKFNLYQKPHGFLVDNDCAQMVK